MATISQINLCYYPTATILVDDNKDFLIPLSAYLIEHSNLSCYLYDESYIALKFLNEEYQADPYIKRCLVGDEEDEPANHVITHLDITAIHKEIYNSKRFNLLSNLVIDYAMPGITGADFCRQMGDEFINKIMLTGEGDKDLAVQLFNEGKINKFIMKNTPDVAIALSQILIQMQQGFFAALSKTALNQLTKQTQHKLSCLSDQIFIALFNEIYEEAKAIEYYLLDDQGSFLFLDQQAKASRLIVVSEEEMDAYYHIAKYGNASEEIVKTLEKRAAVPYFPDNVGRQISPLAWEKYLYPAKILEAKERYYYAFITDSKATDLQQDKIVSYQTYLDTDYQDYLKNSLLA